jgi:hypothetical protein
VTAYIHGIFCGMAFSVPAYIHSIFCRRAFSVTAYMHGIFRGRPFSVPSLRVLCFSFVESQAVSEHQKMKTEPTDLSRPEEGAASLNPEPCVTVNYRVATLFP